MPPVLQKITVPYEYPVYFTVDVFEPGNPDLVDALSRKEPTRRHRAFVVVERAVADAWPGLAATVARYAERHADRLELVAAPWIVDGGEAVKNDPAPLSALQTVLHALRLDRQSYVVIVGVYLLVSGDRQIPLFWPFLLAIVVSAIASVYLLRAQRERFAQAVQRRAERASARFEQMRAKEDEPDS